MKQVSITIGSAPRFINLSLGEIRVEAEFLEQELEHLQTLFSPEAPVLMTFKKIYTPTGFDLEQFAQALGIEIKSDEVIQE